MLYIASLYSCTNKNTTFHIADYGAVGDGQTDDGPAIRKAVAAAVEAGAGSKVVFDTKPYRLAKYDAANYHINLNGVKGITIEGNGAEIINNPYNSILNIEKSENVKFSGFKLDCFPLPFTQGTITEVDLANGKFYLQIHKGYDNPVEVYRKINKSPQWGWGVCMSATERKRKPEAIMHLFIKDVIEVDADKNLLCVELTDAYKKNIHEINKDDRFVITLKYGGHGASISVNQSKDIHLEGYTFYTAKYGMTHGFFENRGKVYVKGVDITFKPGTDRLITTPKDGFHCKHNAVGPVIEDGLYEGMLDDAINISVCPYWLKEDLGEQRYLIADNFGYNPEVGDTLMAYTPSTGLVTRDITILNIEKQTAPKNKNQAWNIVTLNKSILEVQLHEGDNLFPGGHDKLKFTGLYNVSKSGKDYIIRNNTFGEQRRHGILARASGGLIEGNSFIGVGGCGIYLANETGSFYEGPFPENTTIRNNTFMNTFWNPIKITTKGNNVWAQDITITDNYFSGWYTSPREKGPAAAIQLINVDGGTIERNSIDTGAADPEISFPVLIEHSKNMEVNENTITEGKNPPITLNK